MGLVDIVGLSSSILLLAYIGRKWGCFFYYTLAATSLLIMLLVPPEDKPLVVCIAMVGRLGASAAYGIIGLYTTELFPTEVRNSAIGVSSMFGHIGSMMAPFVVDFLVRQNACRILTRNCNMFYFNKILRDILLGTFPQRYAGCHYWLQRWWFFWIRKQAKPN